MNGEEKPENEAPKTERPEAEATGEHDLDAMQAQMDAQNLEAQMDAMRDADADTTLPGVRAIDPEATVDLTGADLDATVNLAGSDSAVPIASPEPSGDVSRTHLKGLIEALIFASDKPIKPGDLAKTASAQTKQVKELLEELKADFASRGVQLDEVAGGWIFRTNAQYAPFVRDLTKQKPVKLSRAQIETLSILAYRQPITRPEIDDVRGVDSGPVLKVLLERDLVRILGKKDEPGRPLLYGTTGQFLEFFGLKSLKDLPTLREFSDLTEESRRVVERELGETLEGVAGVTIDDPTSPPAGAAGDTLPPSPMNDEESSTTSETPAPNAEAHANANADPDADADADADPAPDADAAAPADSDTTSPKPLNADDEAEFPDDDDSEFDDDDDDDDDEDEEDDDEADE